MTVDHSGLYFRRNGLGGSFIAGVSPCDDAELSLDEYFRDKVCPVLQNRVPAFSSIKVVRRPNVDLFLKILLQVKNSWRGSYEHNGFDDSGIIGPHPYYHNLYLATGFSGFGIQQAPAIGRAAAELILDGDFKTIDLTRFGFDRLIVDKPMYETTVV
jgi:FAD-dependent oxidoreductase domain-containing protein 1